MTLDNPVNGSRPAIRTDYTGHKAKGETCLPQQTNLCHVGHLYIVKLMGLSSLSPDLQSVCGFSCEDIAGMFKELKGLGVVVKQLSDDLRKVVSPECHWGLLFVIIGSLFSSSLNFSPCFQLTHSQCVATCRCNGSPPRPNP